LEVPQEIAPPVASPKMTTPQVSVIIPTCNRAQLVPTAIQSVLHQTFSDFEVVVVDDASDDCVSEVVKSFNDDRLRFIRHNSRRGGAAARNTGIRNSNGEYIAFLDDDDEWYPEKLARQMELMLRAQPEVAAIYTGYVVVDRDTGRVCCRRIPSERGNLQKKLLESNPIGGTSSMLLKRSCLEKVGLFDENLPSFQDRDLWIRISRDFHFDYVQDPLLNYFLHSEKVWTNLEALTRGLEIMVDKYGSVRSFRKQCSGRYLEFGVRFCEASRMGRGRRALWKSILLYPYNIKPYLYLGLALVGPRLFTIVQEKKAKVMAGVGQHGI
jgi:glycosyltransferase involved in cell wall biosynthesis